MNKDVLSIIFSYSSIANCVHNFSLVCKEWLEVSHCNLLWKEYVNNIFHYNFITKQTLQEFLHNNNLLTFIESITENEHYLLFQQFISLIPIFKNKKEEYGKEHCFVKNYSFELNYLTNEKIKHLIENNIEIISGIMKIGLLFTILDNFKDNKLNLFNDKITLESVLKIGEYDETTFILINSCQIPLLDFCKGIFGKKENEWLNNLKQKKQETIIELTQNEEEKDLFLGISPNIEKKSENDFNSFCFLNNIHEHETELEIKKEEGSFKFTKVWKDECDCWYPFNNWCVVYNNAGLRWCQLTNFKVVLEKKENDKAILSVETTVTTDYF
ncbi:hypothetical protein ABK040_007045 [Willaertia magna]